MRRGEVGVTVLEVVAVDSFVGVGVEDFADDLDGKHFGVGGLWVRTTLADTSVLDPIIYDAEDGDDEGPERSTIKRPPLCPVLSVQDRTYGGLPYCSSPQEKVHTGLARGLPIEVRARKPRGQRRA